MYTKQLEIKKGIRNKILGFNQRTNFHYEFPYMKLRKSIMIGKQSILRAETQIPKTKSLSQTSVNYSHVIIRFTRHYCTTQRNMSTCILRSAAIL